MKKIICIYAIATISITFNVYQYITSKGQVTLTKFETAQLEELNSGDTTIVRILATDADFQEFDQSEKIYINHDDNLIICLRYPDALNKNMRDSQDCFSIMDISER